MTEILHCGTSGLAEDQRLIVLDRSQIVLPYLKEGCPWPALLRNRNRSRAYINRWAADYRELRMRGRCFKLNADKEKRRTLSIIQELLGRLAMPNLDQVIPTVTEVDCESLVVGAA